MIDLDSGPILGRVYVLVEGQMLASGPHSASSSIFSSMPPDGWRMIDDGEIKSGFVLVDEDCHWCEVAVWWQGLGIWGESDSSA